MVCDNSYEDCKYSSDYYDSYGSRSSYYGSDDTYSFGGIDDPISSSGTQAGYIPEFNRGYLCDITNVAAASGLGAFTFLCAILFALQGWRLWSNKKRGIPLFQFRSSRGLAEISVLLTTLFVLLQLVLGWAEFGVIKSACAIRAEATNMAMDGASLREAIAKVEEAHGSIRSLAKAAPAILSFTFLAFWFARLSNSLQFTVFRLGFSRVGRIILYFQYLLCAIGIVVTGIAIPAIFGSMDLVQFDDSYNYFEYDLRILVILALLHLVADILFIITSMILTSLTSQHVKRLNQDAKARSLWTLNIMSILPAVGVLVTIKMTFVTLIFVCLYLIFTYYFALVLAYLPGYRFWRKTWRDAGFEDDLASNANDEEAATTQPQMTEKAMPVTIGTPEADAPKESSAGPGVEGDRISVESDAKSGGGQLPGGESSNAARYA